MCQTCILNTILTLEVEWGTAVVPLTAVDREAFNEINFTCMTGLAIIGLVFHQSYRNGFPIFNPVSVVMSPALAFTPL